MKVGYFYVDSLQGRTMQLRAPVEILQQKDTQLSPPRTLKDANGYTTSSPNLLQPHFDFCFCFFF